MIRLILPTLALAGTLVAASAVAQTTRAATLAQVRAGFAAIDIDHDGVLTKTEVTAWIEHAKMAGSERRLTPQQARQFTSLWFQRADTNHDGRVTLAEAEAMGGQMFDRYDTNHDGVISPAERAGARAALKPPAARR